MRQQQLFLQPQISSPFFGIELETYPLDKSYLARYVFNLIATSATIPLKKVVEFLYDVENDKISDFEVSRKLNLLIEYNKYHPPKNQLVRTRVAQWLELMGAELLDQDIEYVLNYYPEAYHSYKNEGLPAELCQALTCKVKGQHEPLKKVSTYFYEFKHYWSRLAKNERPLKPKNCRLIIGETGTGKTYSIKTASKIIDAGVITVDCSSLTAEGYVGAKLYTEIRMQYERLDLSYKRNGNVIVYLDEFDKLVADDLDVKASVMNELLVLLDNKTESIVTPMSYHKDAPRNPLRVADFCFILSGAFSNISEQKKKAIGFSTHASAKNKKVSMQDLINYGVPKEILGRLGGIIQYNTLGKSELLDILRAENSPLEYFEDYFIQHGRTLEISNEDLNRIAEKAIELNSGARALFSLLNEHFSEKMYNLNNNL